MQRTDRLAFSGMLPPTAFMNAPARPHLETDETLVSRAAASFDVPGRLDAINPAVDRVLGLMRLHGRPGAPEFEVETALREALSNAIRHGCRCDSSLSVNVRVGCDPENGITIAVRDPGPGFDPSQVPSPTAGRNIYRHHGRGLYLIRQLMDEVSFGDRGREIRMTKR